MPTLYHDKISLEAVESTTSQAGYGPLNLANESIDMPWRAAALGAEEVTLSFASSAVAGIFLHDVNFAACMVQRSDDGVAFVDVGEATAYPDEHGRYRILLAVGEPGQEAVRIQIEAGASLDGLSYWRAGAAHLFAASQAVATGPNYGYGVNTVRPRVSRQLLNGQTAQASTGVNVDKVRFTYERKHSQLLRPLREKAERGVVVLSMDLPDWPWQAWPVRYLDEQADEVFHKLKKAQGQLTLTEVV